MSKKKIIEKTKEFAKIEMQKLDSGHDWFHIVRVNTLAKKIAKKEKADMFVVELAALLHDVADAKYVGGDETLGPQRIKEFLESLNLEEETTKKVIYIVEHISFRKEQPITKTKELMVVQDADRLDALGAIGIGRVFSISGKRDTPMYDPEIPAASNLTREEYKKGSKTTINHFYEKLLLLKDLMNTETARKIAEKRHKFMEKYLDQFYKEWEGKT